jgi:hypothetical protein
MTVTRSRRTREFAELRAGGWSVQTFPAWPIRRRARVLGRWFR